MKKLSKTYQFILVLRNVDENTPKLEDSLYEAGCDDALINFRNGAVYLDFDREASSLEQAVISAIRNVESASIGATVFHVAPEDLVTESEVAKRLKMKRQAVSLWIKGERRKSFPKPVMKLADKSPLWKWREITEWLYKNKLIQEEELVMNAEFLENVNAALEERNAKIRKYRHGLLKKLENHASN
jgi:predicted DNA-binding transcriptional regulator AlpA